MIGDRELVSRALASSADTLRELQEWIGAMSPTKSRVRRLAGIASTMSLVTASLDMIEREGKANA